MNLIEFLSWIKKLLVRAKAIIAKFKIKSPEELAEQKVILINMFGGPGCGKSTMRAGLFYFLKCSGLPCEEAIEYAKGKVYEGSDPVLKNQIYVFGKQHHITFRSKKDVVVIISESPLLLSVVYDRKFNGKDANYHFRSMIVEEHNKFESLNYYLVRPEDREYQSFGRQQDESQAKQIDGEVADMLNDYKVPYKVVPANDEGLLQILEEVLEKVSSDKNEK